MNTDALASRPNRGQTITDWAVALFFGLLTGAIAIIASVSLAALIFGGILASHLAHGIDIALLSATLVGLIVSLAGSFGVVIAVPQDRIAPILAVMAAGIVAGAPASASTDQIFFSVVVAIIATTLMTGAFLLALGLLRAGGLMRFIPYSVLGGFFAGTGWLLVLGGLRVMTGLELSSLADAMQLADGNMLGRWLPGLAISLTIFAASRFIGYAFALPLLLFGACGLFYLSMLSNGECVATLTQGEWLLGPWGEHGNSGQVALEIMPFLIESGWSVVPAQWSSIATILVISSVSILLTVSALEMLSGQDIDINRELRVAGVANLVTGLGGGIVGFHSLGISSLAIKLGAKTRLTGVVAALSCGGALLFGADAIAYLPKIVLGGLLLFLGLSFLAQWLVATWHELPRSEYMVVPLILLVIATVGFVEGVLTGLLAALLLFVLNYSRTQVVRYAISGAEAKSTVERNLDDERFLRDHGGQLYLLKLRGYLFFGTATQLISRVRNRAEDPHLTPLRFVLIDFEEVSGIDSSATYAFNRMALMARQQGFVLLLTGLDADLHKRLNMRQFWHDEGHVHSFIDLDRGLEWYENQLLERHGGGHSRVIKGILQHIASKFRDPAKEQALVGYLREISFSEGHELIRQGEEAGDLYFLEEGEVSVNLRTAEGDVIRIRRTGAGTVVGEIGFYLGAPRSASVVADTRGKAYLLTSAALERIEAEQPEIAAALHRFIADLLAERLLQATQTLRAVMD